MAAVPWINLATASGQMPVVTIFGAGVSGLSLAHELVERGFAVQVVETIPDPHEEYLCQVGGLAANQLSRTTADTPRLHPYLYAEQPGSEDTSAPDVDRDVRAWVVATGTEDLHMRIEGTEESFDTTNMTVDDIAAEIVARVNVISGMTAVLSSNAPPTVDISATGDPYRILRVDFFVIDTVTGGELPSDQVHFEDVRALASLRALAMQPTQERFPITERIQFERGGTIWWPWIRDNRGIDNQAKLDTIWEKVKRAWQAYVPAREALMREQGLFGRMSERMARREGLLVEIRGHCDFDGAPDANRTLSQGWAEQLRNGLLWKNLLDGNPIPDLADRLVTVGVGEREPIGNPRRGAGRRADNRVELRIVENVMPGEHGYRYFPRFYRHLFDTMKRTPVLDEAGNETGDTAFDQLVPVPMIDAAISRDRRPAQGCEEVLSDDEADAAAEETNDPEPVPTRLPESLEDLRHLLRIQLERLGVCPRDIVQFQFRLTKFLTASEARRRTWEGLSWWEFLGADEPGRYSERILQLLNDTPEALIAMNAMETDARTQGVIYCQLVIDALMGGAEANRTLNGPTSEAWLDHWKRYLQRQGVHFFSGTLESLVWDDDKLVPLVSFRQGSGSSVSVVLTAPETSSFSIQGEVETWQPPPGLPQQNLPTHFADFVRSNPDMGVIVPPAAEITGPTVPLLPRFAVGDAALKVSRAFASDGALTTARLWINGVEIAAEGNSPQTLRDHLAATLAGLGGAGIHVDVFGQRSLGLVVAADRAVVSVLNCLPGAYGFAVGGTEVSIDYTGPDDPKEVRDQLIARFDEIFPPHSTVPYQAVPLGRTGILVTTSAGSPTIQTARWAGRVGHGPDISVEPGQPFIPTPGGSVTLRSDSASLGVQRAESEVSGVNFIGDPIFTPRATSGGSSDFYVLAVPYEEASRLVWDAWNNRPAGVEFDGVFEQLRKFDQATGRRDGTVSVALQRDASGRPIPPHWPLRDLSGIQFYFENQVRIGHGHSYIVHSPWGLSSISQLAWWKRRMSESSAFIGQLSVDMGSWYRAFERLETHADGTLRFVAEPSAWRTDKKAIAHEVWRQIKRGISTTLEENVVDPAFYHLDEAIAFVDGAKRCFGRPTVLTGEPPVPGGPNYRVRVGTFLVTVSTPAIADVIMSDTDHLAFQLTPGANAEPRILVAPAATRITEVRIAVLDADPDAGVPVIPGTEYHVSVNKRWSIPLKHVTYTAVAGDGIDEVRAGLVVEIMASLPGVVAEVQPQLAWEDRARGIRLYSTAEFRISTIATVPGATPGSAQETRSLLFMDPGGEVLLEPTARLRLETPELSAPIKNTTGFLINTPDYVDENGMNVQVWRSRPGINPHGGEGEEIHYHVELDRWLMVGNHMATHTRLSTMESANESARHAVIAILHRLVMPPPPDTAPTYRGQGRLHGQMPAIWPPSKYEIDDASPLKRLDERLMAAVDDDGNPLPHFLDILKLGDWLDARPGDSPPTPHDEDLQGLLESARQQLRLDWRFTGIDEVDALLPAAIRAALGVDEDTDEGV